MMSLDDAVELVVYAFKHAKPGDLFVQKAPSATIATLTDALKRLLKAENPVKAIGTRHGEKSHETLLTQEERSRAQDLGDYFRVPSDNRDLNYNLYFTEGQPGAEKLEGYNSSNTRRLDVTGMVELLLKLPELHEAMARRGIKS
jgi:UDP-glucose 4-epimerase